MHGVLDSWELEMVPSLLHGVWRRKCKSRLWNLARVEAPLDEFPGRLLRKRQAASEARLLAFHKQWASRNIGAFNWRGLYMEALSSKLSKSLLGLNYLPPKFMC